VIEEGLDGFGIFTGDIRVRTGGKKRRASFIGGVASGDPHQKARSRREKSSSMPSSEGRWRGGGLEIGGAGRDALRNLKPLNSHDAARTPAQELQAACCRKDTERLSHPSPAQSAIGYAQIEAKRIFSADARGLCHHSEGSEKRREAHCEQYERADAAEWRGRKNRNPGARIIPAQAALAKRWNNWFAPAIRKPAPPAKSKWGRSSSCLRPKPPAAPKAGHQELVEKLLP